MSKRIVIALAVMVVFVLATAGVAYAAWGDSGYMTVGELDAGGTGTTSPHGPYDATSKKCGVCHAVHAADSTGYILLKNAAGADPCVYCHVSSAAGNIVVYNGVSSKYTASSELAHDSGSVGGFDCADCHTVHGTGAATVTDTASGTTNLRGQDATPYAGAVNDRSGAAWTNFRVASTSGSVNLSQWCAGCHPYYNTAFNGASHIMTASIATYGNASSSISGSKVAWVSSAACSSCHDSGSAGVFNLYGTGTQGVAFPHYTDGARFLTSAVDTGTAKTPIASGDGDLDSVCLKCHSNGTAGVGLSF